MQFEKLKFVRRKVVTLGFAIQKAEQWELTWLGLETPEAVETASVWLSLGKLV